MAGRLVRTGPVHIETARGTVSLVEELRVEERDGAIRVAPTGVWVIDGEGVWRLALRQTTDRKRLALVVALSVALAWACGRAVRPRI